ncbi:hypothetical protein CEXT_493411 [Caerostris extrusa]|uniref:Uncharacterized protein n=1 Tax=Caerostris extrusa TaxID=172846 RepID=A0AAV4XSP7_CAEEX|nr:hypothetical protein CEXT_493411 [Caerostris extrusa]
MAARAPNLLNASFKKWERGLLFPLPKKRKYHPSPPVVFKEREDFSNPLESIQLSSARNGALLQEPKRKESRRRRKREK